MQDSDNISRLIGDLASDLRPVRRIEAPWLSALFWSLSVLALALVLVAIKDYLPWAAPMQADVYTWPGIAAAGLTGLLAAFAAFQISLPDRNSAWAFLPLPPFLAWIVINGIGCIAYAATPGALPGEWPAFMQCLSVLIALSVPLSVVLILMVRRARPLRPSLVALMGGLAVAGAAQTLLVLVHPHDATLLDLAAHGLAVVLIVGLNAALGGRLLVPANKFRPQA